MNELTKIIIDTNDPLEKKGRLFIYGIEERLNSSLDYIKNNYKKYTELGKAIEYVGYFHTGTIKSDINQLLKLGYYPASEVEMELDHAFKHALIGSYKSSFSDLRRAIELCIVSVYLSSEQIEREKAVAWIMSISDTPGFSKALTKLIKHGRYKEIEECCQWKSSLQNLYWLLSDYCHNKGQLRGYRELNDITFFTMGTSAPSIKNETLELFCDLYIKTVKEIVAIQSLYNPIILVGVPFDEKFGLEGPMSGYFNDIQAEMVKNLLPNKYKVYFDTLIASDEEIESVTEYFNSLPDLTASDLELQVEQHEKFLEEMNGKSHST
jgi:hypothetical protein